MLIGLLVIGVNKSPLIRLVKFPLLKHCFGLLLLGVNKGPLIRP